MTNAKTTILVVEDEPLIRMSAVTLVVSAGFLAVEARNADEAIRILEKCPDIALVFTDVQMPGTMDGIRLCHHIRERWPLVKLLVVSGQVNIAAQKLPVDTRFFSKPYRNNCLLGAMIDLLAAEAVLTKWIHKSPEF
jgi:CheY-like chemotaxis protein